jgi:hypothetical protein
MGLLDGDIAELFRDVFGDFYLDGTILRDTYSDDGFGGVTRTTVSEACKVQRDVCTESQRAEEGYAETDVRLIVLSPVDSTCRISLQGRTYQAGPTITRDPAGSYWETRGIQTNP